MKTLPKITFLLIAFCCFLQTNAADIYWSGSGGDWSDITKWSYDQVSPCGCLPAPTDDAIISTDFIIVSTNTSVNSIDVFGSGVLALFTFTIESAATLTINGIGAANSFKLGSNMHLNNMGSIVINYSDTFGLHIYGTGENNGEIVSSFCDNAVRVKGDFVNNGLMQLSDSSYGIVCDGSSNFTNNGTISVSSSDLNYWPFPRGLRISSSFFENYSNIIISGTKIGIECGTPFGGTNVNSGFYNRNNATIALMDLESIGISISTGTTAFDFINEIDASISVSDVDGFGSPSFIDIVSSGFDCVGNLSIGQ